MKIPRKLTCFGFLAMLPLSLSAETFDITRFGATANDETDDTKAIEQALEACGKAGGGSVFVPAGVFLLSRHGAESPILEVPPKTTFHGEGPASTLKFTAAANEGNFWRMIGAPVATGTHDVVIRDLHLDGANSFPAYIKGETPEHNAGIWFYNTEHAIENILIQNVFAENFAGDCLSVSRGCRAITIRDCTVKNFIRQGIQMGGDENARDYLVTGCRDLEHTVKPGGSTLHVEHARGLKNVILENNQCRKSILAGGVDGLIIRGNTIDGRLVGNGNLNQVVEGNLIRADEKAASVVQLGYAEGLIFRGNVIEGKHPANKVGLYIWGTSRYNSQASENLVIAENHITAAETAISLNGTNHSTVANNQLTFPKDAAKSVPLLIKRSEDITSDID
ncbi:MAG: right-handed parallel beta-helix repeat-containing protein [Verrucomicrobiae bacterium]|nr:right-handed parallel beta-helix repeat-containing protein [Verrucomicrobiae bacterium]